jgi:hypothetical protein
LKRFVVPAAAAAVLLIAAAWWLALRVTSPSRAEPKPSASSAPSAVTMTPAQTPALVPNPGAPLTPATAVALQMRDQIRDATNLRAIYDRLKAAPDPTGENSYRLAEAIFECSAFIDAPADELSRRFAVRRRALENPRRQELFAFMVERCKGFSGDPAALAEITKGLHRRAEVAGYPAEIARSLRFEANMRDPERADEVAMAFLNASNPDPDVVHELAEYLNARNMATPSWRGTDSAVRSIAWGLLECEYGADCGPRSRPVVMTCIVLGACDLQRVEDAILAQGTQAVVNNSVRMRDVLARQIAARDWAGVGFIPRIKAPQGAPQ